MTEISVDGVLTIPICKWSPTHSFIIVYTYPALTTKSLQELPQQKWDINLWPIITLKIGGLFFMEHFENMN